jgi:uncharacterized protein YjgD (DUF1641 family)
MKSNGASSWQESDAGRQLMERFSEEKTLKALDHLLQRIDTLEKAVENLSTLLQQGPVMASMAADSVDEVYRRASDKGINLEERLANALHLGEQLTAPEMREKIDNLLAFAEQSPALFTMAIDSIDESFRRASSRGVNIDERLRAAAAISEKLTRPEMMERFDKLIDLAGQAPGITAMVVDTIDESYRKALESGLDLGTIASNGLSVILSLSNILSSEEFTALMNSKILSPNTLKVVSGAAEAMVESRHQPTKKMGLFGIMRALNDPDRQKAIGFIMSFMKAFGKQL